MIFYSMTHSSSFNNSFCTFGININDTYITRCGHCYSTIIDQGHETNHTNNSVTCYTINGEKLWEFKDESVLRQPVGVAVDNNCNIYVASFYYSKVIVLSPDGKQWRQLLDKNDGMSGPYIDRTTNNILINNLLGSALMYHIS
jgi:hypothetical protein